MEVKGSRVGTDLRVEVGSLRRQVRWLQAALIGLVAVDLAAAAPFSGGVLHARGLIIEDGQGRARIVMGAPAPRIPERRTDVTTSIVFRSADGADRLILGEEPGPRLGGRTYRRNSPGWGLLLFNKDGDERGGLVSQDAGRTSLALDRADADAVGLMVDENSGFAGLVVNYDGGRGRYPTAIQLGVQGSRAFARASNTDGSPAGEIVAGGSGSAHVTAEGRAPRQPDRRARRRGADLDQGAPGGPAADGGIPPAIGVSR